MNHGPIVVRVADPSTVGGRRYPKTKRFEVLREAERYAKRANELGLGASLEPASALMLRLAEIKRDNARAAASRRRCPGCGCTSLERCVLELGDAGELARCAAVGELPGHATCSGCLTPDLRVDRRLWNMPDPETLNEMIRLGLARPVLNEKAQVPR